MKMLQVVKNTLVTITLGGVASFAAGYALAQDANSEVSVFSSPEWQVLGIHDLVCVNVECEEKIGAIVASVELEGNAQAIEISPDNTAVRNSTGESEVLSGVLLMEIPSSAKASITGLMTGLHVQLGDTLYEGQLYGFRYDGKFSESLVSGGMSIGVNGPTPSQGSQAIMELVPNDSAAWMDHGNLPLQRVVLSGEKNTEKKSAIVFIMTPDAGERMLLAGPKGETVTIAFLFTGNHEDFELLELSETESLKLRPGTFSRFVKSVSDWWAE